MSYDIHIEPVNNRPHPYGEINEVWWRNYTSNVAPMWRLAMPETDGLAGMHGMRCADAAQVLAVGIARMEADTKVYKAMNPKNGWGSFDGNDLTYRDEHGQLGVLKDMLEACLEFPDHEVRISR